MCWGADPFANFNLELSYITASPLGVPQQVVAVNRKFPGPVLNVTTNYNVAVNVKNKLNENLLITWSGIQCTPYFVVERRILTDGYLGQETYMRIVNPEDTGNKTELPLPDNALFCGALNHMQRPQKISSSSSSLLRCSKIFVVLLMAVSTIISGNLHENSQS